ncbi:hypothetical protein SAMN05518683_1124 [Salibacterium halotolerans]|uniref:Uncharacterized protein n=1 Tax=Salibacterium halotolerans TaxID=1884432 RepID=A0A1I5U036_9BACI|nr:hypothetical protein SAMN05518683_1124 [Salibacterium halotolerans]
MVQLPFHHRQEWKAASPEGTRRSPWILPSKNNNVLSTDHRLVDTTPLKSGGSGCRRKPNGQYLPAESLSIPRFYFHGHYVCYGAI